MRGEGRLCEGDESTINNRWHMNRMAILSGLLIFINMTLQLQYTTHLMDGNAEVLMWNDMRNIL